MNSIGMNPLYIKFKELTSSCMHIVYFIMNTSLYFLLACSMIMIIVICGQIHVTKFIFGLLLHPLIGGRVMFTSGGSPVENYLSGLLEQSNLLQ